MTFWSIGLVSQALLYCRKYRDRELEATALEAKLAQARLDVLKSELHPLYLLFLDVQMPEMDGFKVLAALDELCREGRVSMPAVVFVTAHDRYALRAFDVHALDYLHVGKKVHLLRETMSGMESRLDPDRFQRVHRSAIVRLEHVRELRPKATGDYEVSLRDETTLPLGRTHPRSLRSHLSKPATDG